MILLIVLEVILTPLFSARIPHLLNLQRGVVGVATAHLAPGGIPVFGGGGGGPGGGLRKPTANTRDNSRLSLRDHSAWLVV